MKIKTWMVEAAVVSLILGLTAILTGNSLSEWVGAAAVFCTFGYTQIADRLQEQQDKAKPTVPCFKKMVFYFVAREALWLSYFLMHRSYSALVGVGVFLLYPVWRKVWRLYHPQTRYVVLGEFSIPIPEEDYSDLPS